VCSAGGAPPQEKSCYKGFLKVLKQACHYYSSDPGKASILYFCSILVTQKQNYLAWTIMMSMHLFSKTYDHIKLGGNVQPVREKEL